MNEKSQQHHIQISQQARFFTLGELSANTRSIWLVCHGYGQLAPYFIRHFQALADAGHYIVAPEGLSRFYLQGTSGRVGASWMTKEDRQADITNYVAYITAIYEEVIQGHPAPLNLLGFSQGVATISRWAMLSGKPFQQLVLWAGIFPPDLPLDLSSSALRNRKVSIVYGDEDPYLSEKIIENQLQLISESGITPGVISFSGKHEINAEVLKSYFTD